MKVIPCQAALDLVLPTKDDCFSLAFLVQEVLCEIEHGLREKLRRTHMAFVDKSYLATCTNYIAEIPERRPETGTIFYGPAMQCLIISKFPTCPLLCLHAKLLERACRDAPSIGLPQRMDVNGNSLFNHHSSQNHVKLKTVFRSAPTRISKRDLPPRPCLC